MHNISSNPPTCGPLQAPFQSSIDHGCRFCCVVFLCDMYDTGCTLHHKDALLYEKYEEFTDEPIILLIVSSKLTGILLSSPEKTKKKDKKRAFRTPVGSKRIATSSRIELKPICTSNRVRDILIPSLSRTANRKTSEVSNS